MAGDRGLEIASFDERLAVGEVLSGAWMDDGRIYFTPGLFDRPLWQADSAGGDVREVDGLGPNFGMTHLVIRYNWNSTKASPWEQMLTDFWSCKLPMSRAMSIS